MIKKIAFTLYPVDNMERARHFYKRIKVKLASWVSSWVYVNTATAMTE